MKKVLIFLVMLMLFASCSSKKNCVTLALMSINDFHGAILHSDSHKSPGVFNIKHSLDSLREEYPFNITFTAGDLFGANYFCEITDSRYIPRTLDYLDIDVCAIGNHEFDNGQAFLAKCWYDCKPSDWNIQYLAATIKQNGEYPYWLKPMTNVYIPLPSGKKIDIAVVGLISKTALADTKQKYLQGLTIDTNYVEIMKDLQESQYGKDLKYADIRCFLTHLPTDMKNGQAEMSDKNDSILSTFYPYFSTLFTAHSHKVVSGYINEMPVIQGGEKGRLISLQRIVYDTANNKIVKVLAPATVPVTMQNLTASVGSRSRSNKEDNITSSFRHELDSVVKANKLNAVIAVTDSDLIHDRESDKSFTALGAYVCRAYADAYRPQLRNKNDVVIGLHHGGGIRESLFTGDITILDACDAMPFNNSLSVYEMTGEQLKYALDTGGLNNPSPKYGYLQSNNLIITEKIIDGKKRIVDLWYVDAETKLHITDDVVIYVVADDYVSAGGDNCPKSVFTKNILKLKERETECFRNFIQREYQAGRHLSAKNPYLVKEKSED